MVEVEELDRWHWLGAGNGEDLEGGVERVRRTRERSAGQGGGAHAGGRGRRGRGGV